MSPTRCLLATGLVVGPLAAVAPAQHHHHHGPAPPPAAIPAPPLVAGDVAGGLVRSGAANINIYIPNYLLGVPGLNYQAAASAHVPGGPGIAFPFVGVPPLAPALGAGQPGPGGLMLPQAAPDGPPVGGGSVGSASVGSASRSKSGRTDDLVELGDRSFRGGNYHRAEERYQQALRAQKDSPDPHIRLAQVALVRRDYDRASAHLRDAVASAQSAGWLLQPRDIEAMFGEPGDFSRQVAQLETHLQAHPRDRNAWFVLGAEQHLSGRHEQAHDAFVRLTDRPADPALSAFLDATTIARRTKSTHESASPSVR